MLWRSHVFLIRATLIKTLSPFVGCGLTNCCHFSEQTNWCNLKMSFLFTFLGYTIYIHSRFAEYTTSEIRNFSVLTFGQYESQQFYKDVKRWSNDSSLATSHIRTFRIRIVSSDKDGEIIWAWHISISMQ